MSRLSHGFTVVEVMVTLLIAAMFILGGYQAYTLVINGSRDSRNQAEASNIAYELLRRQQASVPKPCAASNGTGTIPSTSTLPTPRSLSYAVDCPFGTSSVISRVTVTLSYGSQGDQVVHASYNR